MSVKRIIYPHGGLYLGCDPEFFFVRPTTKRVVGSERVLPSNDRLRVSGGDVATDGVQAELHPRHSSCRETLAGNIDTILEGLERHLRANHPELDVSLRQVHRVGLGELQLLGEHARTLGCAPSLSAYGETRSEVDGTKYLFRSAAGHIHLGLRKSDIGDPNDLVKLLDLMCGIPCVLLDRDARAKERRRYYGRAGEYRLPSHGLEYRVPSNFWLCHYSVYSLVMSMARNAVRVHVSRGYAPRSGNYDPPVEQVAVDARDAMFKDVNWDDVRTAINKNDAVLARAIYMRHVHPVLKQCSAGSGVDYTNADAFVHFADKGLLHWFGEMKPTQSGYYLGPNKQAKMVSTLYNRMRQSNGWESFCSTRVAPQMTATIISKIAADVPAEAKVPAVASM